MKKNIQEKIRRKSYVGNSREPELKSLFLDSEITPVVSYANSLFKVIIIIFFCLKWREFLVSCMIWIFNKFFLENRNQQIHCSFSNFSVNDHKRFWAVWKVRNCDLSLSKYWKLLRKKNRRNFFARIYWKKTFPRQRRILKLSSQRLQGFFSRRENQKHKFFSNQDFQFFFK